MGTKGPQRPHSCIQLSFLTRCHVVKQGVQAVANGVDVQMVHYVVGVQAKVDTSRPLEETRTTHESGALSGWMNSPAYKRFHGLCMVDTTWVSGRASFSR